MATNLMQPEVKRGPDPRDKDSLFILPLSMLPLVTEGLRKARLIKNSRLEARIELFTGSATGSGQIKPKDLVLIYRFDERNSRDLDIMSKVSKLPSYDVFSLRIALRKLDIEVDDHDSLRLSDEQVRQLNDNMKVFIKPLIASVFGKEENTDDLRGLVRLIRNPNQSIAQANLKRLSDGLGVEYHAIPNFLEDYGDIYLSLAYYQYCLDRIKPGLQNFFDSTVLIQRHGRLLGNPAHIGACKKVADKLRAIFDEIETVLDNFRAITEDMWDQISGDRFQSVERTIRDYQTKIGGALCSLTVKINAWDEKFPDEEIENHTKRADFIMSEMRQGIEKIEPIGFQDAA